MKWTTPAFVLAPAFILALAPAGFVNGQSSNSNFDQLAPGPIAELLPESDSGSGSFSGLGIDVVQPPGQNQGIGSFNQPAEAPPSNPLPGDGPSTPNRAPSTGTRRSLINEPVPYSQVPQIQSDIYSLDDTFTLPRTPVTTTPRSQTSTAPRTQMSTAPRTQMSTAPRTQMSTTPRSQITTSPNTQTTTAPRTMSPAPPKMSASSVPIFSETQGLVYPQTDAAPITQFEPECTTCEETFVQESFVQPCDVCNECETTEIIVDDCGCGECESFETVPCSSGYFETEQHGYVVDEDLKSRTVKHGLIGRHLEKHCGLKDQHECSDPSVCGVVDDGCYPIAGGGHGNVYQPVIAPTDPTDVRTNTLLNVSGVFLNRNMPDVLLSSNRVAPGGTPTEFLSTDDADFDTIGGVDATFTRRRGDGKGYELRYLGLTPGQANSFLGGSPVTVIDQFANIGQAGGITHQDAFNISDVHEIARDMSIQNAEFNFLRMGRLATTRFGQSASTEYLLGFRYFKFEESLRYSGFQVRNTGLPLADINRADFISEVENELYGAQFGGRSEISLFNRMSFLVGLKAGIFSNDFSSRQEASVQGNDGGKRVATVLSGPNQGTPFQTFGEDNDFTLLAELDLGLAYQITNNIRFRGGYKAIFVDDIALADTQAAGDFRDLNFISRPTVNDDLVLYGGYFGLDYAF